MAIYQLLYFGSSPNLHGASNYIWGHIFWPNQYLDPFSTSKWPLEPQFCERYTHIWQKMARTGRTKVIYKGRFICIQTLLAIQSFLKRPQFCKYDLAQIVKIWVLILHIFGTDMKFAKNRPFWITQSSNWHPLDITANV